MEPHPLGGHGGFPQPLGGLGDPRASGCTCSANKLEERVGDELD